MASTPIYIALKGMEVYLTECFFHSIKDRPRRFHHHPAYELVCIQNEKETLFQITPPLVEHIAVDAQPEQVCSLLFSFTQDHNNDICQTLKSLTAPITIVDDFCGSMRINSIKDIAKNIFKPGATEHLEAELRLLFICLAEKLHSGIGNPISQSYTLDKNRLAILEDYFNVNIGNSDSSKGQLASALGVSERQLTRILEEIYHSSYSEILLRSRMSIASAMAAEGLKSTEEIASAVGYRSAEALRRAYRTYYGYPLRIQKRT